MSEVKTEILYDKSYIDVNVVKKFIKSLKIPKEYFKIDLDKFFSNDFSIYMSIRENAGKTTQALILGLVLNRLYGTRIEYMRCDEKQIAKSSVAELFGTVEGLGYIEKIFPKQYNHVKYSPTQKAFKLCWLDDEGVESCVQTEPFCVLHSLENWQKYKSSYNSPKGDFIIFDEFLDTSRLTYRQMTELMNNISTIGRVGSKQRRNNVHVLMLGNNTDEYSHWWDDFTITEKIRDMQEFGSEFEVVTELGTSIHCKLIDINENKKQEVKQKKIKFFGFNTPEMAQFNGTQVWSQTNYPQIPDNSMLNKDNLIFNNLFINHRDRYIQLDMYHNQENGYFVFLHWANKPDEDRQCIILTMTPNSPREVFGFGKFSFSDRMFEVIKKYVMLQGDNRWYYHNNQIGAIVDDFVKNTK